MMFAFLTIKQWLRFAIVSGADLDCDLIFILDAHIFRKSPVAPAIKSNLHWLAARAR